MLHDEKVATAIAIYLISKTVLLSLVLMYHMATPEKEKIKQPPPQPEKKPAVAPRVTLTVKGAGSNKKVVAGAPVKTSLQQTIEDTFSSN